MNSIGYLIFKGFVRLLAALGGLWASLLVAVAGIWASSHMVLWWLSIGVVVSSTICLVLGVVMVTSRRRWIAWSTLYGACAIALLGANSFVGNKNSVSLLFILTFFVLTITAPAFVALMCLYDLFGTKKGGPRAAFLPPSIR